MVALGLLAVPAAGGGLSEQNPGGEGAAPEPGATSAPGSTSSSARPAGATRSARGTAPDPGGALVSVLGSDGEPGRVRRAMARGTHMRLTFAVDAQRVALGDSDILDVELITDRELLVTGEAIGQSSVTLWFVDGRVEQYLVVVQRDLSVLREALLEIHPNLRASAAPDRDAVVLRGRVPDISYAVAAESAAQAYLDAGERRASRGAREPIFAASSPAAAPPGSAPDDGAEPAGVSHPGSPGRSPSGRVINLVRVEALPLELGERIRGAIAPVGGKRVVVRRIQRGDIPGPSDTFVLSGVVQTQRHLVRVLTVAARLLQAGGRTLEDELRVIADESGALARERDGSGDRDLEGGLSIPGFSSGTRSFRIGSEDLSNRIRDNIGRATAVELMDGQLLSFIEVEDLPQVRVDVRLYEVNRSRLHSWQPRIDVLSGDVPQSPLLPAERGAVVQGDDAGRVGGRSGIDFQEAFSLVSGAFTNQLQVAGSRFAIDTLFSLMAERGIARRLASPSLLVLSGEIATFQVGGEIPVPASVIAAGGEQVFGSVFFTPFGIQLGVRPLVGSGDRITLDLTPQILEPDPGLTAAVRRSTGERQRTTSFGRRSLATTAQLQDGQALMIGGLLSRTVSNSSRYTPWFERIPLLGWFGKSNNKNDQDLELVVVVSPTILRESMPRTALWDFPDGIELLRGSSPPPWFGGVPAGEGDPGGSVDRGRGIAATPPTPAGACHSAAADGTACY